MSKIDRTTPCILIFRFQQVSTWKSSCINSESNFYFEAALSNQKSYPIILIGILLPQSIKKKYPIFYSVQKLEVPLYLWMLFLENASYMLSTLLMLMDTVSLDAPWMPYLIAVEAFRLFLKCLFKSILGVRSGFFLRNLQTICRGLSQLRQYLSQIWLTICSGINSTSYSIWLPCESLCKLSKR